VFSGGHHDDRDRTEPKRSETLTRLTQPAAIERPEELRRAVRRDRETENDPKKENSV
jgi:hypothetical protein